VRYSPGAHGNFDEVVHSGLALGSPTPDAPATPGNDGWQFNGWSPVVSQTVKENVTYVAQWTQRDLHGAYITGYPDGTAGPDSAVTRAEVATIIFRLLTDQDEKNRIDDSFIDVPGDEWYTKEVNYLLSIGILNGYPCGSFKPNQNITRAEFVTIIARINGLAGDSSNPFSDVTSTHWAYESILSVYAKGWINVYPDDTFKPENNITRAEVISIVNRMLGRKLHVDDIPADLLNLYPDLSIDHWAFADFIEASATHGYDRKPNGYESWINWSIPELV